MQHMQIQKTRLYCRYNSKYWQNISLFQWRH